jgi:hypothetical protein
MNSLWNMYYGFFFLFNKTGRSYLFAPKDEDVSWPRVVWCRFRGHPYGVIWYNPNGMEPDMTCTNCYDDLG